MVHKEGRRITSFVTKMEICCNRQDNIGDEKGIKLVSFLRDGLIRGDTCPVQ